MIPWSLANGRRQKYTLLEFAPPNWLECGHVTLSSHEELTEGPLVALSPLSPII